MYNISNAIITWSVPKALKSLSSCVGNNWCSRMFAVNTVKITLNNLKTVRGEPCTSRETSIYFKTHDDIDNKEVISIYSCPCWILSCIYMTWHQNMNNMALCFDDLIRPTTMRTMKYETIRCQNYFIFKPTTLTLFH